VASEAPREDDLAGAGSSFCGAGSAGFMPGLAAGWAVDLIVVGHMTICRGHSAALTNEQETIASANVIVSTIPATSWLRVSGFIRRAP
jgi:hypothetical protein